MYILNAAAFPDAFEVDYDSLLSYVLARLPGEDELLSGTEYEVIFFAGGQPEGATTEKKQGPGMGWYLQAYHVLSRATRKKLQRLYIVHPRTWVRVLVGVFGTVVSPKFRRKIIHINTLSQLALQQPIYRLLIPPAVYLHDRKLSSDIEVPYASGRRAFGARHPFPKNISTGVTRLPRVLRETTSFILLPTNIATEGLFRIPPHSVLAGVLKEAYDRGQQYIVWKEKDATVVQPGIDQGLVDEVRLEEAYGIHLAASLIKTWYRELREPIFPETSYEQLRQQYSSPDAKVTPEDIVDLILPASDKSPLSGNSREVLTRHLLPLMSEIAAHEAQNKMSAENLAICFSMCLVCGSDQLQDAKMSSIIRRILQAAIEMWPQLRDGLGIEARALETGLQPPADPREYEDPMEDESHKERLSEDDAVETREAHRIMLNDYEEEQEAKGVPKLPPRPPPHARSRATSAAKQLPVLPVLDVTSPVKRKPAPNAIDSAPAALDPPRYSTVFDADGSSLHVDSSPTSYAQVDGFGPPRRADFSYDGDKKKGFPVVMEPTDPHPALSVPKRKALSREPKAGETPTINTSNTSATATPRSASEGSTVAKMAAQKATTALGQRMGAPKTNGGDSDAVVVQSPESISSPENGDGTFRKPSWPASAARQQHAPDTSRSLAKPPTLPVRQSHTVPKLAPPPPSINGTGSLGAPSVPKPRTPSPGLLARMSTMEAAANESRPGLAPKRLNLKKASVDDLRRLYEERVSTAESLMRADAVMRGSTS